MKATFDSLSLMEKLARLKRVPLGKVLRNTARDFAFAAQKATPRAKVTKKDLYYVRNASGDRLKSRTHPGMYMTVSKKTVDDLLAKAKRGGRARIRAKYRKVRIKAGYDKSTWLGVFRGLGVSEKIRIPRGLSGIPFDAKSASVYSEAGFRGEYTMTDKLLLDAHPSMTDEILRAGFARAASVLKRTVAKEMKKAWS